MTDESYRTAPLARFAMGQGTELVYVRSKRAAQLLSVADAEVLSTCGGFATLAEHAKRLSGVLPSHRASVAHGDRLSRLVDLGLLIGRSALLQGAIASVEGDSRPGISWLAIPTCDRPEALKRALRTYLASLRKHGRAARVLVADDSFRTTDDSCKDAIRSVGKGAPVYYAGRKERREFAEALVTGGVLPRDVVSFGLFGSGCHGPTIGANRNSILLATAGNGVLCVDDDTLCLPATSAAGSRNEGLVLGGNVDPTEFWFFRDRAAAFRSVRRLELDPLTEHGRLLGRTIGQAVHLIGEGNVDCDDVSPRLLTSIMQGRGRIRVTLNGVVGDSAMYSNPGLHLHSGDGTRRRLVNSAASYRVGVTSREVVRYAPRTTISESWRTMSTFIGLDNSELLPPFVPAYRNEDGLFGHTLGLCFDHSYSCHLPWVLLHAPIESRSYHPDGLSTIRVSDVLTVCLNSWTGALPSQQPSKRMHLLGAHLRELGAMGRDDFRFALQALLRNRALELIAHGDALLLQHAGEPAYWANDLKRALHALGDALTKPSYVIPLDMRGDFQASEAAAALQVFIGRFGELLCWWPALVERARELRESDRQLGQRLL